MPRLHFPSVLLCLTGLVTGQATNVFEIYPDAAGAATTYVTRMNLGSNPGEMFQEVPNAMFRGVGDASTGCTVSGFRMSTADENGATQETYNIVLRKAAATGGPDTTASGALVTAGPFLTPVGTGRVGWQITATFSAPVTIPCEDAWFLGIEVQTTTWTADGQSLYVAYYYPPTTRFVGDNPRGNATNHSWYSGPLGSGIANAAQTVRVAALTTAPVLNMGSIDPLNTKQTGTCWGAGGLYPDITGGPRVDGIEARVRDVANTGGQAVIFLANGLWPVPGGFTFPGVAGRLWLDPLTLITLPATPLAGGEGVLTIVPPNVLNQTLIGWTGYFQALTVSASLGNASLTNVAAVSF